MLLKSDSANALLERVAKLDASLMAAPRRAQYAAMAITAVVMIATALPHVPRQYVDYANLPLPLLHRVPQHETYGTDTIADMYEARVILNDPRDMYTKVKVDQTPLEARTWSKAASAPYPPTVLLAEAGLSAIGDRIGIGFYGMILGLAILFVAVSAWYFLQTRWYLFPLLYLNFSYFGYRFVYVQDGSYLVMLVVILAALLVARRGHQACHALMALAITMKLSPLYYAANLVRMRRPAALLFLAILAIGLVLPWFVLDNYSYIYLFNNGIKGEWEETLAAAAVAVPFAVVLRYVETRLAFDLEDRVGWGLVPVAMFLGLKMNVARHVLIPLLVPDKRGIRNLVAAVGLALHALFPSAIPIASLLAIGTVLLIGVLIYYLSQIGWDVVREDARHPARTLRMMLGPG